MAGLRLGGGWAGGTVFERLPARGGPDCGLAGAGLVGQSSDGFGSGAAGAAGGSWGLKGGLLGGCGLLGCWGCWGLLRAAGAAGGCGGWGLVGWAGALAMAILRPCTAF